MRINCYFLIGFLVCRVECWSILFDEKYMPQDDPSDQDTNLFGFRETTFQLYSPNQTEPQELIASLPESMTNSSFNVCLKTVILITGFKRPNPDPDIVEAAYVLANKSFNAIIANYDTRFYVVSVPIVGTSIAMMVRSLNETLGYDQSYITLMGFSLGAHVAGFAGSLSKVGRIMGIDPAGPYYDFFPSFLRLDRSDATFVDTLHSSLDVGTRLPRVGHIRFVLDGGRDQPGCDSDERYCSHFRSSNFTKASIDRCVFTFQRCFSYIAFRLGWCENYPKLTFGLDLNILDIKTNLGERYYHDTTQEYYPFCRPEEETEADFDGKICL